MRFIFSVLAVFALSLGALTACKGDAATSSIVGAPKTGNSPVNTNVTTAPKTDEHGHEDDAPRITLADAKKDFDEGKAIFIDTRSADAFNLEHIKGAINITTNDVETRYKEIPAGRKIIVYCS